MMPLAQTEPWLLTEPDVMEITGRLDDATVPTIEEDVLLCIQSGARRMILDCSTLTYITGAGLRSLLTVARSMQRSNGRLFVCALQDQVAEMFRATGIDGMIPVYIDQNEAVAALAG